MKNLILLSFFLPFKSHKGVNLPFGENGEGSYYDKCNSSEAHLSWCALKHTKSSSSIITSQFHFLDSFWVYSKVSFKTQNATGWTR